MALSAKHLVILVIVNLLVSPLLANPESYSKADAKAVTNVIIENPGETAAEKKQDDGNKLGSGTGLRSGTGSGSGGVAGSGSGSGYDRGEGSGLGRVKGSGTGLGSDSTNNELVKYLIAQKAETQAYKEKYEQLDETKKGEGKGEKADRSEYEQFFKKLLEAHKKGEGKGEKGDTIKYEQFYEKLEEAQKTGKSKDGYFQDHFSEFISIPLKAKAKYFRLFKDWIKYPFQIASQVFGKSGDKSFLKDNYAKHY